MNMSVILNPLWWAAIIYIVLAATLRNRLGIAVPSMTLATWSLGLAAIVGYLSARTVPVQNKGVMLILGRRIRPPVSRLGYNEGLNIPWLPDPLATLRYQPTPEFRIDFENPVSYSKENAEVRTDGYAIFEIVDAYQAASIEDLRGTAEDMASKIVRETTDEFSVYALMQADERDNFSRLVMVRIRKKIAEGGDDGESYVRCLRLKKAEITHVDFDKRIKDAYSQKVAEPVEGELEMIQLKNRLNQTQEYINKGVKPDTALAASLVDADKPGARVSSVSIRGLGKVGTQIGEGLAKLGEGLSDLATGKGKGD